MVSLRASRKITQLLVRPKMNLEARDLHQLRSLTLGSNLKPTSDDRKMLQNTLGTHALWTFDSLKLSELHLAWIHHISNIVVHATYMILDEVAMRGLIRM
jgi:hypothetical protein